MCSFVGILGNYPGGIDKAFQRLIPLLTPIESLNRGAIELPTGKVEWALVDDAPFSTHQAADGTMSFVIGSLGRDRYEAATDAEYLANWSISTNRTAFSTPGDFFAAVVVSPDGSLTLTTDAFGIFPVYYLATPDWIVFGTSTGFFGRLPHGKLSISGFGLTGILLTNGLVGGQTLWDGVKRLSVGGTLAWSPGKGASESIANSWEASDVLFGASYEEHLELLDSLLRNSVARGAGNGCHSVLLSGGMDSRMIAGYLHNATGGKGCAITFGRSSDLEMRAAFQVARDLHWKQDRIPDQFDRYVECAYREVENCDLSYGMCSGYFWLTAPYLLPLQGMLFNGLIGDAVVGGTLIAWGWDPVTETHQFENHFAKYNRYGIPVEIVNRLVRPEVSQTTEAEIRDEMRKDFNSGDGLPFQKAWGFGLRQRARYHACSLAWRTAFGRWPVQPYADRDVLTAAAGMPLATVGGRRAQTGIYMRSFPELARLPLDRNSYDASAVAPRSRLASRVGKRLSRAAFEINRRIGRETRSYFRVFDINNSGWRAVRHEAESHRRKAEQIFDPKTLAELVPPPDANVKVADGIIDTSGMKLLLGMMLWAGRHL